MQEKKEKKKKGQCILQASNIFLYPTGIHINMQHIEAVMYQFRYGNQYQEKEFYFE